MYFGFLTFVKSVVGFLGLWAVWYWIADRNFKAKVKKLGAHPAMGKYFLPYGLDLVYNGMQANRNNKNMEFFRQAFDNIGRATFMIRVPEQYSILTIDPENIKAILATQFHEFGKGSFFHEQWEFFLGDGIFNVDGHQWSDARALLRPQFHKQRVSDLHVFEEHISKMISLLPKDGSTVDLLPWWYRFTLDSSTDYLFGSSVDSLQNPKTVFAEAFSKVQEIQTFRTKIGPAWKWYYPAEFKSAMSDLNNFIEPFVERAIAQSFDKKLLERKEERGEKVNLTDSLSQFTNDRKTLRDQLVSTLLASRDTTACTLAWLFYELAYHPDVYARLRKEVLERLGVDGQPTYEDLKSMKYLQWCLNEVLRLYPSVPVNVRCASVDTTLPRGGGPDGSEPIGIPKDVMVIYFTFLLHRREDLFGPTVNDFDPSRWQTWTPAPWTYIPFNGGPRICLGQNFALTEIGYATCRMCQTFERLEERSGLERGEGGFKTDIILSPLGGVKVGLIRA